MATDRIHGFLDCRVEKLIQDTVLNSLAIGGGGLFTLGICLSLIRAFTSTLGELTGPNPEELSEELEMRVIGI